MVSSTLALLKYPVIYKNMKQGSGPDRGYYANKKKRKFLYCQF